MEMPPALDFGSRMPRLNLTNWIPDTAKSQSSMQVV